MSTRATEITLELPALPGSTRTAASIPGLLRRPDDAFAMLALAHGAGAGMRHPHLERLSERLADQGIATLRYEFAYMAAGSKRPDRPPLLHAAVRTAVAAARELCHELPLFAGGRSMGGRMTSQAEAVEPLGVSGLVFFAFPLHPPKQPGIERARHLFDIRRPMLFVSGTRDALADLELLHDVTSRLGARAQLREIAGANHSFERPKRFGSSLLETEAELAALTAAFARSPMA